MVTLNAEVLRDVERSLKDIGYRASLIRQDYPYAVFTKASAEARQAVLAAFAQDPPSAFTACIGFTTREEDLTDLRYLGAPVIIHVAGSRGRFWQNTCSGPILRAQAPLRELFGRHKADWSPDRIFRAKSVGMVQSSVQLDFVDIGLLPAIEREAREKLDGLIRSVVSHAYEAYRGSNAGKDPSEQQVFRLLFRLIQAKVLADTNVLPDLSLDDPVSALRRVEQYSPSETIGHIDSAMLHEAAARIAGSFPFSNITVDTLAYVYENTLVTSETRKTLSVHHTPSYLAEYMVSHLPLADLDIQEIRVSDPMCGHGTFLVAALRMLRSLLPTDWSPEKRHDCFLKSIEGGDVDPFSVEVAKLSLTLADLPHPNGWNITRADAFRPGGLERAARRSTVFLTNPPFEAFDDTTRGDRQIMKGAEMLVRVLPSLPEGAVVGVVVPISFLDGRSYQQARHALATNCEIVTLLQLPDNVFERSDAETVVVLARRRSAVPHSYCLSYQGVAKRDLESFKSAGVLSRDERIPAEVVIGGIETASSGFWIPRSYSVWESLADNQTLRDVGTVHRGVEYLAGVMTDRRDEVVRDRSFPGAVKGLDSVHGQLQPFLIRSFRWLSTAEEARRGGAWDYPWSEPKVVVNAVRQSRGPWRMMATYDTSGLFATQCFHGVWPSDEDWGYVLAALLNSAIANAYVAEHESGRHIRRQTLLRIPLPPREHPAIGIVAGLARACERRALENPDSDLTEPLLAIDAELLRAYDLRPGDERGLLDMFSKQPRPGCPSFNGFYPPEFAPTIPLHVFLSHEFREARADRVLDRLPQIENPAVSDMLKHLLEAS